MIFVLIYMIKTLFNNYAFIKMHSYYSSSPKSIGPNLNLHYGNENKNTSQ